MHFPSIISEGVGWLAYHFAQIQPFLPTYTHLLVSALFPIYAGAHSSLSRPASAAKAEKKKGKGGRHVDDDADEHRLEGLTPRDAILFPILAGCTLAGLYFLIKWLQDPAILNKILNYYFATFSVFAVSKLVSDSLDVLHSFLFPHEYADKGRIYRVDPDARAAGRLDGSPNDQRSSPLPGPFSRLPLPSFVLDIAWILYVVPARPFRIRAFITRLLKVDVKLGIHGIEGFAVGLSSVLYFNFVDKPWYLTNLMGFGFAYGSLQVLSPTTFATGSLVLSALFFYDIYFVFFTPMMVTVAKSIEIPAKLLFPRPADPEDPTKRAMAMLGLGDIVLPGIMIGLALRFDLYLFYFRKQSSRKTIPDDKDACSDESKTEVVKAPYQSVAEGWGDRFWTSTLVSRLLSPLRRLQRNDYVPRTNFPKPYFHAGMIGYLMGMLATLLAMQISDHPQPALLYLVPGVVGSLWLTAALRGELKLMWSYSDDGQDHDEQDKAKTMPDGGRPTKEEDEKTKDGKENVRSSFFSLSNGDERAKVLSKVFGLQKDENKDDAASGGEDAKDDGKGKRDGEEHGELISEGEQEKEQKATTTTARDDEQDRERERKRKRKQRDGPPLFYFIVNAPDLSPLTDDDEYNGDDGDESASKKSGGAAEGRREVGEDQKATALPAAAAAAAKNRTGGDEHMDKRVKVG